MGRTQLNIRLSEDKKEEWAKYVDEARWDDTLTDFVKTAVRERIERMDSESGVTQDSAVIETNNDEIIEELQDLRTTVGDMEKSVSDAVDAVHAQEGVDTDVAPKVYSALPDERKDAVTAEEIAEEMDIDVATVRFSLETMRDMVNSEIQTKPEGIVEQSDTDVIGDQIWWRGK